MMNYLMVILFMIIGYVIGSVPSGVLISIASRGIDPRQAGSGNIGATNILRVVGKKEAALTLLADILKGLISVWVAFFMKIEQPFIFLIGSSAILGHLFPLFLKLKGGKGVAVSFGVFLGIAPKIALIAFVIWCIGFWGGRYSSTGALAAFGSLPFLALLIRPEPIFILFSTVLSIVVYFRHWENIRRLLHGEEKQA